MTFGGKHCAIGLPNSTTGFIVKKLNVGIIGYGWAATAHIDAINASGMARVTHVYSSRLLDDDELSVRHGSRIKTTTHTDLWRFHHELEADFILSPGKTAYNQP